MHKENHDRKLSREILQYLKALHNEIEIDLFSYRALKLNASNFRYAPRPSRWYFYCKKFPSQIRLAISAFELLWNYCICFLFFLYKFCKYLPLVKNIVPKATKESNIALAFSERATELINKNNIGISIDFWIVFPWANAEKLPKSTIKYDIFSIMNFKDLIYAYRLAIKSVFVFNNFYKSKSNVLQTYNAFEWFCTKIALQKMQGNFYFAEHFDRWAVLIDFVMKDFSRKKIGATLSLIQHGLIGEISIANTLLIPVKLYSVTALYAYDQKSVESFQERVFSKNTTLKKVFFYSNKLILTELSNNSNFTIMFVGSPFCEDLHISIYNKIKSFTKIEVYYKPHPLYSINKTVLNQEWKIINDTSFFPNVNLLISYPSTLAAEYRDHNITVIIHKIDMEVTESDVISQNILNRIERFAR